MQSDVLRCFVLAVIMEWTREVKLSLCGSYRVGSSSFTGRSGEDAGQGALAATREHVHLH